jgi:hypothetical protein
VKIIQYTRSLIDSINEKLKEIDTENDDMIAKSKSSVIFLVEQLNQIKIKVRMGSFSNTKNEVLFFKHLKPSIYSKLIYYSNVFKIENRKPKGTDKSIKKHYEKELNKIEMFSNNNLEFSDYLRHNSTYLDEKYFIRGNYDIELYMDTFIYDSDPNFCTSHDYKVSKIYANDLLIIFLKTQIANLDRKETTTGAKNNYNHKSQLTWTLSKTDCVELIYALYLTKTFNKGNTDLKELAEQFEKSFNIQMDDLYKMFLQIKERKTNPTKFIDSLKNSLLEKLKEKT